MLKEFGYAQCNASMVPMLLKVKLFQNMGSSKYV